MGDATRQLTDMVSEHSTWLRDNCDRQVRKYRSFADARMQQLAVSSASIVHPQNRSRTAGSASSGSSASPDARRQWREGHSLLSSQDEAAVTQAVTLATKQQETALQVTAPLFALLWSFLCTAKSLISRCRAAFLLLAQAGSPLIRTSGLALIWVQKCCDIPAMSSNTQQHVLQTVQPELQIPHRCLRSRWPADKP